MAYSSGGLIDSADYNTFVGASANSVNSIWSTTYNQTSNVANVAVTNTVTATQWASMVQTLAAIGAHTNTTITSRTAAPTLPVTGNTISILANVQTDLNSCYTNRFNAATQSAQFTGWTGTNSKTTQTGTSGGAAWNITFVNTVTWANSTAATSFFNQGGTVKIDVSKNAVGLTGDPEWNDLAATLCGDIYITKGGVTQTIAGVSYTGTTKIGGTGTPNTLVTGTGWDTLVAGAAGTIVYKQFADTAPYTNNYIQHTIAKGASSNVLTITTLWQSADTNVPPVGGTDPISGGTAASGATPGTAPCTIVTLYPPETTNISNNWGAITVAATTT